MQEACISLHADVSECQAGNGRQKVHLTEVHQHEAGLSVSHSFHPVFIPLTSVCLTALISRCADTLVVTLIALDCKQILHSKYFPFDIINTLYEIRCSVSRLLHCEYIFDISLKSAVLRTGDQRNQMLHF